MVVGMTDYTDLAQLLSAPGPVASVYLESPSAVEDARGRLDTAWKSVRRDLEEAGADAETLGALDRLVDGVKPEGATLVAFAAGGQVLRAKHHPDRIEQSSSRFGPLAAVSPVVAWRQDRPSHVVVRVDREGADITAHERYEVAVDGTVDADTHHANRVSAGGWSQRRFQQRAENQWESNARAVAEQVETAVKAVDADLVLVTGDVRMVQFLNEHLHERVRELVHTIDGGRGEEAATDTFDEEVERSLAALVARNLEALLATFAEERGQADHAADGVEATVTALQSGQVRTLLLTDPTSGGRVGGDPDDDRTLWYGPEPTMVATSRQALEGLGVEEIGEGPLGDVLLRAALGTSAHVCLVPPAADGAPTEGVGAILRWA
jgi:peptide subunit release factor 1 (eRF1)